uniref:Uncharacterized protein n=1 Tax=Panagrolaimus sp. JU765 TaxID=591449 RepID=A0AC34PX63_9BILA
MNAVVFLLNCLLFVLIVRVFADLKAVGMDVQLKNGDSGNIYFKGTRIEMKICDQSSKNGQHGFAYFCYRGTGGDAAATETCGSGYCMIKASASVDKGTHEMDINRGEGEDKKLMGQCPIVTIEETEFTADDTKFGGCTWDAKNGSLEVKVPQDSSSLVYFILLKTGLDPEFSTSTFPVYGIVLIVVGIVALLAILITILYCKVIKPRMAKKYDPTTKDLEANVQEKPKTTASSKQEEKPSEPVQKLVPPRWPVVVNEHVKTEEKSWIDSAKHNVLRERKEKMERRNALERERKEREEALEKGRMEAKKKRAEEKAEEERRRQISIERKVYSSEDQKLSKEIVKKPAKMEKRTKESRESVTIEPKKTATAEGRTTEEGKGKKIAKEWKKFMEEKGGVVTFEQEAEEERKAKKEKKKKEGSEEEDEN